MKKRLNILLDVEMADELKELVYNSHKYGTMDFR